MSASVQRAATALSKRERELAEHANGPRPSVTRPARAELRAARSKCAPPASAGAVLAELLALTARPDDLTVVAADTSNTIVVVLFAGVVGTGADAVTVI
jgi:hypothetical protein